MILTSNRLTPAQAREDFFRDAYRIYHDVSNPALSQEMFERLSDIAVLSPVPWEGSPGVCLAKVVNHVIREQPAPPAEVSALVDRTVGELQYSLDGEVSRRARTAMDEVRQWTDSGARGHLLHETLLEIDSLEQWNLADRFPQSGSR